MRFCNYKLPRDSRLGRLRCVRKPGHVGRHWVYILRPQNRLEVFEVHPTERGLKVIMTAVITGEIEMETVAQLAEFIELDRFHPGER